MKCNCGEGVPHEHGSDKIKGVGRRRVWAVALKQIQQQVLKKVLGPALTDCFPVVGVEETVDRTTECEEQSKPDITQAGGPTDTNIDTQENIDHCFLNNNNNKDTALLKQSPSKQTKPTRQKMR